MLLGISSFKFLLECIIYELIIEIFFGVMGCYDIQVAQLVSVLAVCVNSAGHLG